MARRQIFVVNHPEGWAVKRPSAGRASAVKHTQREAIERATAMAKRDGNTEVLVQGTDGKWRSSDTVGRDPNPPKDSEH